MRSRAIAHDRSRASAHDKSWATAHKRSQAKAHDRSQATAHDRNRTRAHNRIRLISIIIVQGDQPHKAIDHKEEGFEATRGVFESKRSIQSYKHWKQEGVQFEK